MSLIIAYANELELIQDEKIRSFVVDALDNLPEHYRDYDLYIEVNKLVSDTKLAVKYSRTFLEVLDASDYVNDIVTSALILQDATRYYKKNDGQGNWYLEEDPMHPLSVRQKLLSLVSELGIEKFDDIMRTIESSHGLNSPIPQVMPLLEDPVYIWILPCVNQLVKEESA